MDLGLRDKVALVVGGSRGIGSYIAGGLADEGCKLAICARGEERLAATARDLEERGAEVLSIALDATDPQAGERMTAATLDRFGRLDVLINNVGGNRRGQFADLTDEDWREIIELNQMSHIRFSRAAIPHMKDRGSGVILFVSSIFGREAGGAGLAIYNTTKSALISVAKIMAIELAPDGVRVLSVAPGSTRFPGGSWDKRCIEDPEGMAEFTDRNLPMGRFGTAVEVADAVTWLVSDRASLITGVCLNIDGGQSRSLI